MRPRTTLRPRARSRDSTRPENAGWPGSCPLPPWASCNASSTPSASTTTSTAQPGTGSAPPPARAYRALPKAGPAGPPHGHYRLRYDHVDAGATVSLRRAGRLYHIGIGRTHARTPVLMLLHDLDIRVINAATGEILRELTLDPDRNYQPAGGPPGPPPGRHRKTINPEPQRGFGVIPMS